MVGNDSCPKSVPNCIPHTYLKVGDLQAGYGLCGPGQGVMQCALQIKARGTVLASRYLVSTQLASPGFLIALMGNYWVPMGVFFNCYDFNSLVNHTCSAQ